MMVVHTFERRSHDQAITSADANRRMRLGRTRRAMVAASAACALTLASGLGWADDAPLFGEPAHLMESNVLPGAASPATDTVSALGAADAIADAEFVSDAPMDESLVMADSGQSSIAMAAVAATTAAGRTPGTFDVSTSGAASYRIPLWTPPGVGDVKLDLALVYNSRAGNGVLGQGWSLAGLSAITRCNKSWAQDGAPAPVTNTLSDRYCLDGQQLKLVSGTPGAPGAVYATEIESFSKIVANSAVGGGPASFTVTTKNGLVYEYGTTPNSQIYAGSTGTIRTWALARIHDRALGTDGNAIAITYVNDAPNGTFRVSEINYPYTATGQGPFYRASFNYSARPLTDPIVGYLAGNLVQELNQLNTITITDLVGGTTTKSYNLSYAQGTASSRLQLTSLQECSATNCLAPTTVTYQQGAKGWPSVATATNVDAAYKAETMPLDLNGDGLADLLFPIGQGNSVMGWWMAFGQPGGFSTPLYTGIAVDASVRLIPGRFLGNGHMQFVVQQGSTLWLLDYNGSAILKTNTGLVPGKEFAAGDIDGDGLDDLISTSSTSPVSVYVRRNVTVPTPGLGVATFASSKQTAWTAGAGQTFNGLGSWKVADFNGDGRADITAYTKTSSGGWTHYWMNALLSNGFGPPFTVGADTPGSDASVYVVGDWNADGCSDLLRVSKILISNCAGGFASITTGSTNVVGDAVLPVDWDEDGRTDLVYLHKVNSNTNTWYVVRSTGSGVSGDVSTGVVGPQNTAWFAFDKDGDGKADLAWRDDRNHGNGQINYHLHQSAGSPADLATNFTDGFGMSQGPSYVSIATSNYTKETDALFPELDFQGPLYVVSQVTSSDGTGSTYQNLFQYYGARVQAQGRGFEGFHTQRTYDSRNGTYTFDFLQRTFPYTGMHTQRTVQPQATGTVKISEWAATVNKQTLGSAGIEQRTFPFINASTDSRYEVGGSLDGQLVTQATDSYTYNDGYGNVYIHTRTVTDKDPTSPYKDLLWQSVVIATYANDPANNCFGLPASVAVSQSTPGQASLVRTSSYSADTVKCRIWQQTIEPSTPALKVTTTLGFDGCGNVNSVQVVGSNPDGSSMSARPTGFGYGTRCQLPETLTNALLQTSNVAYDYDFGVPQSVTDPNGLTTSWQYDDFGRRTLETRPDQTTTAWSFESCSTGPCWGQNDLRFHVYETSKGSASDVYDQREQLYDGFDRLRMNEYMRVKGAWVTEATQYDSLGRALRRDRPTSGASNGYEMLEYDLLNRVKTQKLYQSGGALDRTTIIGYAGRTVSVTNPLGHTRTQITDVAGRLRRVIDPSPGGTTKYDYDSFGNLNRIEDAIGAVSTGTYNLRGFRTQWADADRGTWNFSGDSLNELVSWTDARGQSFSAVYDALGRMTSRTEPDGTSSWTWGNSAAAHNIGSLASKSGYGYTESRLYDSKGRPSTRTITTDQAYQFDYAYNTIGALDTLTYPTSPVPAGGSGARVKVKYGYSYGAVSSVSDVTDAPVVLWSLASANDYESPTGESLGNGVTVTSAYKAWTNELSTRQAGVSPSTTNRQNLSYQWDTAGNLTQRQDVLQGLSEVITPDALDRVKSSTLNGVQNLSVDYDASGNITSKTDVGAYTYGDPNHPHAATAIGTHTYSYDANGNQITRDGASQAWASYNLPLQVAQPIAGTTYLSQFSYGPDHQRWKQVASYSNGSETTYYVGELLEKEVPSPGVTQWRHYVPLPSGMTVLISRGADNQKAVRYLLVDHLGSTDRILNEGGTQVAALSYSSFGARRGSNWSSGVSPDWANIAGTTRQGYTGHEHLDNVQLIHMNGRVYDPAAGRFLSVDPLIGDMEDSQQVNPYAYVGNRPLTFTDPTGLSADGGGGGFTVGYSNQPNDGSPGTWKWYGRIFTSIAEHLGILSSDPPPPPASVMVGQSAQSGMNMCGPGQWGPVCGGWVLSLSGQVGEGGGHGRVPSSTWSIETSAADPYAQENLERLFYDLGVNAVDIIILAPYYDAKHAYEAGRKGEYATAIVYVAFTICDVSECKPLGRVVEPWARVAKNMRISGRAAKTIHVGRQGKHIPGHNNYIPGRSPLTHRDPQGLLDQFGGKGQPIGRTPIGQPGSKERVDFGEVIGEINGQPTTRGIIHYSKDGAHIVPANP